MNRIAALQRHLEQSEESTKVEGSSLAIEANNVLAPDAGLTDMLYDYYEAAAGTLEFSAKKHGGQLVAEVFKAHGVRFVFTLSGGHVSPILVAAENIGIKVIDCRHEVTTVYAADACARIEGTCGVAVVTAGPGLTNTITAVKNAQMAESPVLLISGAAATLSKGRGALQDIEQVELLKGLCKYTATCSSVRDIVPILRKAFQQAQCGVPGPVYVEMPLDVLYPITEAAGGMSLCERKYCKDVKADQSLVSRVIIPSEFTGKSVGEYLNAIGERDAVFLEPAGKGAAPWYVSAYMKAKLRYLYANCWKEQDFSPLPVTFPTPKEYDVDETVKLLKSAKNPLLLIGSQATVLGPKMANALASACAKLGIPVFLGGMARGLLGKGNRLHIRQNRGIALSKADVVILAGAICDFRLGYGQQLKKSKIITINRSVPAGTMNAGLFWNPTIIAESDPGMFVCEVARKFDSNGKFDQWVGELKSAEKKTEERNKEKAKAPAYGRVQSDKSGALTRMSQEKGKELINPLSLLQVVEEILPENALLIGDGGDFVATASYILHPRGPLRWMDSGAFGTLGVGGGFALGAKLCRPDLEVWIVYGDGSSGYSLAEFDTYDRHGAPIIALIGNDASWTQIEREQVPMFGSEVSCALSYRDYDKVAIGYGGEGIKLEKPNEDEIREKLIEAQKIAKTKPVCVNALIGGTDFREGSISV